MAEESFPTWDNSDEKVSVNALYQWICDKAEKQITWYEERRKKKRWKSLWTRGIALFFAGSGGLCPLYSQIVDDASFKFAESGYILIALAAGVVAFDRFYGFSSSWMRFARTQMNLIISLDEFRFEWASLQAQNSSATTSIQKLKEFSEQIDHIVKVETEAWISEFQSNLKEMEKMLKTSSEERKPGNIKVTVSNATNYHGIAISVDGVLRKKMSAGVSEALIEHVLPGTHELLLVASDSAGKEHQQTKVVTVTAGATEDTTVTI